MKLHRERGRTIVQPAERLELVLASSYTLPHRKMLAFNHRKFQPDSEAIYDGIPEELETAAI